MEIAEHLTGLNVSSFREMLSVPNVDIPSILQGKWGFELSDSPSRPLLSCTHAETGDSRAVRAEAKQKYLLDLHLQQTGIINDVRVAIRSPVLQL